MNYTCAHCKMTNSDPGYLWYVVTRGTEQYLLHTIRCLAEWSERQAIMSGWDRGTITSDLDHSHRT